MHAAQSQQKTVEYKNLIGRWVRPDGGYVLHFKAVNDDGSIDAEYLNPNPINVSMAKVSNRSDKIDIFVELRDIGYPGSFYTLVYEPDRDRLVGVYHHLVNQQLQLMNLCFVQTHKSKPLEGLAMSMYS